MKLLSSLSSLVLPLRSSVQALFTVLVFAAVAGLEVVGRSAKSDVQDSVYALVLAGLIAVVVAWHRRRPLQWVDWLTDQSHRLLRWLKTWKYDHGIDFRGTPPLPRKVPRGVWGLTAGVVAWAVAGVLLWEWVPGGWRTVGVRSSYVLYLVALLGVWAVLVVGLMGGMFLPLLSLDRRLQDTFSDHDRRLVLFLVFLVYLITVTAAAAYIPVVVPLGVCAVAAGVAFGWAARRDHSDIAVLWRTARGSKVFSIPMHRVIAGGAAVLLLTFVALVLNGRGGRLLTHVDTTVDAMPLTASFAALVAWTVPGLLALLLARVREKRTTDPANRTPANLHVVNKLSADAGEKAKQAVTGWGWGVRVAGDRPTEDEVPVELVHPELSEATEFDPRWPLKVATADLDNPLLRERLARRDEIRLRRRVFRGLNALIKKGVEARKEKGGGFWLAPHWWFIDGLGREDGGKSKRTEDGESELLHRIGPPFARVFGERPRQHLHQVLRAVQVDVIYIEDGVPLKALTKVIRQVFEVYDVHAGKKLVDDHCFKGIPKVRVMVHEFSPIKPPTAVGTYRQPKFDDLSRGRVLHIFRDKGDHEEVADTPRDFDYVPSPSLVG